MSDNDTKPKRHFFLTEIAEILGVNEAIMLNHLIYWIASNSINGTNHFDGRYWTYNSAEKYDSTGVAIIYEQENPYINIKVGDLLYIK